MNLIVKLFSKKENKKKKENVAKELEEKIVNSEVNKESFLTKKKRTIKDFIANCHIDFASSPKMISIGDKYYAKSLYIGTLPNAVNFATFLHTFYNFGNINVSIHINPIDIETAKAELSTLRTNLKMEEYTANGSINREEDMAVKAAEAGRLRAEIRDGKNKLYEVAIYGVLYEEDERSLNNACDSLKQLLGNADIGLKSATYCQEELFKSTIPLMDNLFGESHTFDKRSLACIFPFTTSNINHKNGTLLGFNLDNDLPVQYDNFDESLPNYNIFCFAQSGIGKSTLIKTLAARTGTVDIIQDIAIDIEHEYRIIADTLGGVNITIAPETDTIINPFDVEVDIIEDKDTKQKYEKILLSQKVNNVTNILMTLARGYTGNNKYYDDITRNIIRQCVESEYKRIEITEDPDSLYEVEDLTFDGDKITGGKKRKLMPTISSWYEALESRASKNSVSTFIPYYDYLLMVMSNFSKKKNGGFTCFDGQTTVKLSYDIPFINFDLSRLNEKNELPLAQYIICDYIWEVLVKRNVPDSAGNIHKIRVIIDEAWRLIKFEESLEFLITMVRRARKKNTSTCVITQQFDEFYKEETKPIIKQSATKFFLRPDNIEVDDIKNVFKLTEGETNFLKTATKGQVLMKVNNVSVKVENKVPSFEKAFIETNQNKLKEGA